MRPFNLLTIASLCVLITINSPACADGLIYRLPEDGASIEYEAEMSTDAQEFTGSLTISSVGKEEVDGKACRWIEFKFMMAMGGQERVIYAKALVPEDQLGKGKNPIDNMKKAWYLPPGASEPREVENKSDRDAGPMPAFLAGPLKDQKELAEETVKTGLGELKCKGVTGTTAFEQGERTHKYTFTNRLNEKAPFGVVASEVKFTMTSEGGNERGGTMKLTAKKVGKGATSRIKTTE